MTIEEIIGGLKFTVDMFLLDPVTGEVFTEPRNNMDKTTIDACKGAIELLEQTRWIPVRERLPKPQKYGDQDYSDWVFDQIIAELDKARFVDKETKLVKNANASGLEVAMEIIDKYRPKEEPRNMSG